MTPFHHSSVHTEERVPVVHVLVVYTQGEESTPPHKGSYLSYSGFGGFSLLR